MLLKLNLTVKCKLCGNNKDTNYYIMPKKQQVKDGFHFSATEYGIVCKICGHSYTLKTILE